jgi:signal transduction histidine kinase
MPNQYPEIYTQFLANILITSILIGFIISTLLLYQKRKRAKEKEIELLKNSFEKELLQTRLEIQEDVLKNISMEIHDNIGQVLLLANINVSMLESCRLTEEAPAIIAETSEMLNKAIEDVSHLSRGLHSDRIIEIGVFNAIIYELELLSKKGIYTIDIRNEYPEANTLLSNETQLIVFRIFQELMKNIIKHSKATNIEFVLLKEDAGIEIQINDNGIGFDGFSSESIKQVVNGIGLRSIEARIKFIKGKMVVNSDSTEGTKISINLPITLT